MTRVLLLTAVTTAIALGTACGNDRAINSICGFPQPGFDIEEASTLQDGQGYSGMHDAVVLTFEEAVDLPASSSASSTVLGTKLVPSRMTRMDG